MTQPNETCADLLGALGRGPNSPMPEIFTRPIPFPGTKSYWGPLTRGGDVRLSFVELYDIRDVFSSVGVKMPTP